LPSPESLSPRVQRKRDAKTLTILTTAEKIIVEEGLDALTIHRLAKALDYAPGALYRYFSSKESLLSELSCRAVHRIHLKLDAIKHTESEESDDPKLTSLGRLLKTVHMYVTLVETDPAAHRLVSSLLGDPKHLLDDVEATRVHNETLPLLLSFTDLIRNAEQSGALIEGPSSQRAVTFWAGLQGIVQLRKLGQRASQLQAFVDPETIATQFVRDLLRGWGANDTSVQDAYRMFVEKA
jgi:AcrR family transcriptional regulator